jgi:hypothetical protein
MLLIDFIFDWEGEVIDFFNSKDFITSLDDGSELYKCSLLGPPNLLKYATGTSQLVNNVPFLKIYHHTTNAARESAPPANVSFTQASESTCLPSRLRPWFTKR